MSDAMIDTSPPQDFVPAGDGARVPVRIWTPPRARRVVVALHGMVTHAGWFAPLGALLVERGVALVAPDRRGNGHARGLGGAGDLAQLLDDVARVVRYARGLAEDITLLSWCGSANFAVPAALGLPIARLVLASPGLVPRDDMAARFRAAEPVAGYLPIHFDPAADFTDDPAVRAMIRADPLYLRRIPVEVRAAWRALNPRARAALASLAIPVRGVLARTDRMIDIPRTVALLDGVPIDWADGGHGFVVEPAGARRVAELL